MELLTELLFESRMSVGDAATAIANVLSSRYGYYTDDVPKVEVHDRETASVSWDGPMDWTTNDPYWFHEELASSGFGGDYSEGDYEPYYDEIPGFETEPYNGYTLMVRKV
jgi:hypothetical protein